MRIAYLLAAREVSAASGFLMADETIDITFAPVSIGKNQVIYFPTPTKS